MIQENMYHRSPFRAMYPTFLVLFLVIGVFITVNQSQISQDFSSHAAGTTTNCTITSAQTTIKSQEQQLFNDVNEYRATKNLGQLTFNSTLKQSAAWLSSDMASHNTLSHTDSLNRTPDVRLTNCGYTTALGAYGETIADGPSDANTIFNAWGTDPAHNAILTNPSYTIAGVDMETNSSGTAYWTMDFGTAAGLTSTTTVNPTVSSSTITPTSALTATLNPTATVTSAPSSTPIQPSATPEPVAADMLISVSVQINGIGQGGNPHPVHLTRKVTVLVYGEGTEPVTTGTAFLTYDGNNYFTGVVHLGKLAQGSYFLTLSSVNTLQVIAKPEFQNLLINRTNVIPPVTLYQGDMNGDNILDINDYNLVLPCFQSIPTCASVSSIDFNDDGKVDVTDYNLLLQSFETLHGD